MTGRAARLGRLLLVAAAVGTAGVLVLRLTGLQELHALLLGATGAADVALAALLAVAVAGVVLLRGAPGPSPWWRAAAVALPALVLVQVSWPGLVGLARPESATGGRPLSVAVQNLWLSNPDPAAAARTVLEADADVLVLTELTAEHLRAVRQASAFREYPHRVLRRRDDTQGMAVLSRVPLVEPQRQPALFRLLVRLEPPGARPVTLVAVHLPAPHHGGAIPFWRAELRAVTRDARRAAPDVVVAGDFNAEDGHVAFRHLTERAGLRSAQDHGGGGLVATWPTAGRGVPPLLRLDHVLVGDAVGVAGFSVLPRIGADHLGVRAELRVPAARARP